MARAITSGSLLLIVLAIIFTYPFVTALLIPNNIIKTPFSIYNTDWNGASKFKEMWEEAGAVVKTIAGSTNTLNRLNTTELLGGQNQTAGTLVILGPTLHYDFSESLSILLYLARGGRVIIADDFGTANDILALFSSLLAFLGNQQIDLGDAGLFNSLGLQISGNDSSKIQNPIIGIAFNKSLLLDQGSYEGTPAFPVFKPPQESSTGTEFLVVAPWVKDYVDGVTRVIGNYGTILSMKVRYPVNKTTVTVQTENGTIEKTEYIYETKWVPFGGFPFELDSLYNEQLGVELNINIKMTLLMGALYSSQQSWLETDLDAVRRDPTLSNVEPNTNEWGNPETGFPVFVSVPLGFSLEGSGANAGELILSSDPSIFINQYLDKDKYDLARKYDNYKFAQNLINKLMSDRPGQLVIFDEAHLAQSPISPVLPLGLYLRYLDLITMFPLFAPFLPLTVLTFSRKYLKERVRAKPMFVTRVERYYGRSFFATKMRYYTELEDYARGLEMIFRRIKRQFSRKYGESPDLPPDEFVRIVQSDNPTLDAKYYTKMLSEIYTIIENDRQITEDQFLNYYFALKDLGEYITGRRTA